MAEQQAFFDKLNKIGMDVTDISDVLALTEENLFDRRLQTFIFKKKLANTVKMARQLIVHKNILVDGAVVNIPSFVVTKNLEDKIALKERKIKKKSPVDKATAEEIKENGETLNDEENKDGEE